MNKWRRIFERQSRCLLFASFAIIAYLPSNLHAQSNPCTKGTTVVFVNGVLNDYAEAYLSARRAGDAYLRAVPIAPDEVFGLRLAYNSSHFILDFVEAANQILAQPQSPTLLRSLLDGPGATTSIPGLTGSVLSTLVGIIADAVSSTHEKDLSDQIGIYKQETNLGHRVVLISHSQGGLFANEGYDALSPDSQKYVGILEVATPAASIPAALAAHVTVSEDLVIVGGSGSPGPFVPFVPFPGAPFALDRVGIPNGNRDGDWLGHGFIEIYIRRGSQSRAAIDAGMRQLAGSLKFPADDKPICQVQPPPPTTCVPAGTGGSCVVEVFSYSGTFQGPGVVSVTHVGNYGEFSPQLVVPKAFAYQPGLNSTCVGGNVFPVGGSICRIDGAWVHPYSWKIDDQFLYNGNCEHRHTGSVTGAGDVLKVENVDELIQSNPNSSFNMHNEILFALNLRDGSGSYAIKGSKSSVSSAGSFSDASEGASAWPADIGNVGASGIVKSSSVLAAGAALPFECVR